MTEYRKQLYERVKHGRTIGIDDRSALVMIMDDCERYEHDIKSLNMKIAYLESQLEEYHKYDSFLYSHGLFTTNATNKFGGDPGCIAYPSTLTSASSIDTVGESSAACVLNDSKGT